MPDTDSSRPLSLEEIERNRREGDEEAIWQKKQEEDEDRISAIDEMVNWFNEQFEDPANQTSWDNEDKEYIFICGGPFNAGDVLGDQFSGEHHEDWIQEAIENVESDGIYDWAPQPRGEFYERPEDDDAPGEASSDPTQIAATLLTSLDELESRLDELTPFSKLIGHNQPPEQVGRPPYDEEDDLEIRQSISQIRAELKSNSPDKENLQVARVRFEKVGMAIISWIGQKSDLVVDEAIKAFVKVGAVGVGWNWFGEKFISIASQIAHFLNIAP